MSAAVINSRRPGGRGSSQRGEGRLKTVIWLTLIGLFGYTCYKIVPAYVADYQVQDKMQELARYASVFRQTDEQIRDSVWREVQDLNLPVTREQIKIENDRGNVRRVRISLDYTVPLDLFFYHTEMHFNPSSENKSLT